MKRLLNAIFGILAVACFASCLLAIYWIWTIKQPVIEKTSDGFDQAEKYLAIADKALTDVKSSLQVSQAQVQLVSNVTKTDGEKRKSSFLHSMMAPIMRQAIPNVNETQRTLEKVTEVSIVVNSILDTLQENPIDPKHKLESKQVSSLQSQLDDVTKASWELGNLLDDPSSKDGDQASTKSERIAASLGQVIALADELQGKVKALEDRVKNARQSTMYWLKIGPTLATFALSWMAFSQLIVLVVAVRAFRRPTTAA